MYAGGGGRGGSAGGGRGVSGPGGGGGATSPTPLAAVMIGVVVGSDASDENGRIIHVSRRAYDGHVLILLCFQLSIGIFLCIFARSNPIRPSGA